MALTVHEVEVKNLKETLQRLDARRTEGKSATAFLSVDVYLLEDLVQDHDDLVALLKAHPELRAETKYG